MNKTKKMTKTISLDVLKLNERNPRKISDAAFQILCKSIKRDPKFMELRPIIIDEKNIIIGGNQRYKACLKLGKKEIPAAWVQKVADLTAAQRKRFILLDNAPDGMVGYWDWDIINEDYELPELEKLGFSFPEEIDFKKEWEGMPEFEQKDQSGYQIVAVHFKTKKDVEAFAKLIKQRITARTKYIWFPEVSKEDIKSMSYKSES